MKNCNECRLKSYTGFKNLRTLSCHPLALVSSFRFDQSNALIGARSDVGKVQCSLIGKS